MVTTRCRLCGNPLAKYSGRRTYHPACARRVRAIRNRKWRRCQRHPVIDGTDLPAEAIEAIIARQLQRIDYERRTGKRTAA